MQKAWLIIQREYLVQVRQKSFLIMTLLAPVFLIGVGGVMYFLNRANLTTYQVAVIDENPKQRLAAGLRSDQNLVFFFFDPSEKLSIENRLKNRDNIDALLVIPPEENLSRLERNIRLYANDQPGRSLLNSLTTLLNKKLESLKLEENGIDRSALIRSAADVRLKVVNIKAGAIDQDIEAKTLLSMVMMYTVMMFIIIYSVRIMRSVIEEKNSRIVEIVISSVKPFQLMIGKILGTALVALTQFMIWVCCALLAVWAFENFSAHQPAASKLVISFNALIQSLLRIDYLFLLFFLLMFIIYFIGGYLLLSAFFAAIGSIVESEGESQQYSILPSIVLVLGFFGGVATFDNPMGWASFWLSIFPLTSPIVMLARIPYGVPLWQLAVSLSLLSFSVWGMIHLAAKIYRVEILNFGGQNPIKSFLKSIRQKN